MLYILVFLFGLISGAGGYYVYQQKYTHEEPVESLVEVLQRPLDTYTIENLAKRTFIQSSISLDEAIEETASYTTYQFSVFADGKKATGIANIPKSNRPAGGFPVIVQIRGYVPKETFQPGSGTIRSGQTFAENGFITLAPDFLGYGGSDFPSDDIFEERFQTYIVAASLISSVGSLPQADASKIGLWGHSNGGHIALTVLEILGRDIPTSLWAPVTKPFPYSILYYTDEASDSGKFLRSRLAAFETLYDTDLYSLTKYIDRIQAPLQIHQGTLDPYVPVSWSDAIVEQLRSAKKEVEYYVYPGADHNLRSTNSETWNTVVRRDIDFFRMNFGL